MNERQILDLIEDKQLSDVETRRLYIIYSMFKKDETFRCLLSGFTTMVSNAIIANRLVDLIDDLIVLANKYQAKFN